MVCQTSPPPTALGAGGVAPGVSRANSGTQCQFYGAQRVLVASRKPSYRESKAARLVCVDFANVEQ